MAIFPVKVVRAFRVMSDRYAVTIWVTVTDEAQLRAAAAERAVKEGCEMVEDAGIHECLQMVFDPGESPPGCRIDESGVEVDLTGNLGETP